MQYCIDDGSSYANTHQVRVTNYTTILYPHIATKTLDSTITYYLEVKEATNFIVFDTMKLKVKSVTFGDKECEFETGQQTVIGSWLKVTFPEELEVGDVSQELVIVSNTAEAQSLTWGSYVFTQNQPIYCRSLFPCQDTPSSKSTFDIQIILDEQNKKINVFASGIREGDSNKFRMNIPIPSYLFAFLIGNFEHRMLNDRLGVVAEPQQLDYVCEQVQDSEKFLSQIQDMLFEYKFGQYNLAILPKSFPYGGMQNPIFTFLSPTVITGDKTGLSTVIHEMAHSWTGNLISCKNWQNFWMNEGFTVFVQINTIKRLYGQQLYQLCGVLDQNNLLKTIDNMGKENPFTQLQPTLNHCNPDDAFSIIPYMKGMIFLTYQQSLIGQDHFLEILKTFLNKYSKKSIDYLDWKRHLQEYLQTNDITLSQQIDWETWVRQPGYPPKLDVFKSFHYDNIKSLVSNHKSNQTAIFDTIQQIMSDFSPLNIHRLQLLFSLLQQQTLTIKQVRALDTKFKLTQTLLNFDILSEWFKICLKTGYVSILERIDQKVLKRTGRMKYIRPLYKYIKKIDQQIAIKYFLSNQNQYSIIANELIKKDLGIK